MKFKKLGLVAVASIMTAGGLATSPVHAFGKHVDGPLTKVGTYTKDEQGKATLIAIKKPKLTKTIGSFQYKIVDAKLIKFETTRKSQRSDTESNFGQNLPKTYYEYQLGYTLKNNSSKAVTSNGAEIINAAGKQMSANQGAMDSLIGEKIQAGASKSGFVQCVASKSDKKKMLGYKLVTPELVTDGNDDNAVEAQTVNLK